MTITSSYFSDDMREIINDQPISCQFGSVSFNATQGEIRRTNDVAAEGILNEADLEIMAVISDFTQGLPNVQSVITVAGVKYHVQERVIEPFGVTVHFVLRRI